MIAPVPMTVADLLVLLGRDAPWEKAAEWDPVGLQLGDPGAPVGRAGVCHEVTAEVVEAVEREPVDLLVSYHPLLFRPTQSLVAGETPEGRALRLVRAGVALAVAHTNFDAAPGGSADALAAELGLEEVRAFGALEGRSTIKVATFLPAEAADRVLEAAVAAGAARIGNYTHCSWRAEGVGTFFAAEGTRPAVGAQAALNREPEVRLEFLAPRSRESAVLAALVAAHPYEEPAYDVYERRGELGQVGRIGGVPGELELGALVGAVRERLAPAALRVAGDLRRRVVRVAVVPGSGGDWLERAAELGADAIVTGDVAHHRARTALDRGLAVVDPGHAATERPGVRRLRDRVAAHAPEGASLLEHDPDPWVREV
jgi:dinuclear metal center YbgI/SA1388 family protein